MAKTEKRKWSELFPNIVSLIAKKLGLSDLLALRSTCRSWRLASSSATAKLKEEIPHKLPWFLCQYSYYKEECIAVDLNTDFQYRMKLPQLIGTKILGSFQGWLLLFNTGGKISFFCPFTLEKICLPDLPQSEICLHTKSVLTSSPTSITDRTICLIWREQDPFILFHYILQPGAESWIKGEISCSMDIMKVATGAAYHDGKFILMNMAMGKEVEFSIESREADISNLMVEPYGPENKVSSIRFSVSRKSYFKFASVNACLLSDEIDDDEDNNDYYDDEDDDNYYEEDDEVEEEEEEDYNPFFGNIHEDRKAKSMYIWGTHWHHRSWNLVHFFNESNFKQRISKKNLRRGIWIHPRLFAQLK
ncbi:uncharacterized protein LOC124930653 [Impatiens glandulifera]|uniref:uncharacterized protein LOC124930653 n=1 Tax=Impatiens glandulifera TaxID=253017 RepID=UPI001FB08600|nr:uncharacterized protein LOC124930653 [Impatiens glandulifera]